MIAAAGLHGGAITGVGYQIALSVIALSLMISPFWMLTARRLEEFGHVRVRGVRSTFATLYESELVTSKTWTKIAYSYLVRIVQAIIRMSRKQTQSATAAPMQQSPKLEVIEAELVEEDGNDEADVRRRA